TAYTLCFQLGGFRKRMTWRQFILALGLHTELEMAEASMDCGTINVPHLLAQYLFRYAEGGKSEARLLGGHFIGRLAMHFGLVSDDGLRGLHVVTRELPLIDLHELGRLHICTRYGETWTWVAHGLERQQAAAAGVVLRPMRQVRQLRRLLWRFQHQHRHLHHLHPLHSHVLCHIGSRGSRRRCTTYGVML
ncbi:hypothetical protein Tco_0141801, partial [Tanacetum coccineum]